MYPMAGFLTVVVLFLAFGGVTMEDLCGADSCHCQISTNEPGGIHTAKLSCDEGTVYWHNPFGALQMEVKPRRYKTFRMCFVFESGNAFVNVFRETDPVVNTKSPTSRSRFLLNDSNLKPLMAAQGTRREHCLTSSEPVRLYLEPVLLGDLGTQGVKLMYDISEVVPAQYQTPLDECRPCTEEELLKAYCSSDFVVVGSMTSLEEQEGDDHVNIHVDVAQIVRQKGSHFQRLAENRAVLRGTVRAQHQCGITRGDGLFLLTGKVRFGHLRLGCAPYFTDWQSLAGQAEREGRMHCSRD